MTDPLPKTTTFSIDRRALRTDVPVVQAYRAGEPAGALVLLADPVLRAHETLQRALDAAAEYCAKNAMDPRWAALLGAFFARDEVCTEGERPAGSVAFLSPAQVAIVREGFSAYRERAHSGARAGAYYVVCPEDMIEVWSVLVHLDRAWLTGLTVDGATGYALRDGGADAKRAWDEDAGRGVRHRFGGASAGAGAGERVVCSCGAAMVPHLVCDTRDGVLGVGEAFAGASVPLLFCVACDAAMRDPLLAYRVAGDGAVELVARPEGCERRGRAVGSEALREAPVVMGARGGSVDGEFAARGGAAGRGKCPRCAGAMRVLATLRADEELGVLRGVGGALRWEYCGACALVQAEVELEG